MEHWTHLFYYIGAKRKHDTIQGGVAPTLEKAYEVKTVPDGGKVINSSCAGLFWLFYEDAEKYLNEQVPADLRQFFGVFHAIAVIPVMSPVTTELKHYPYHFSVELRDLTPEEIERDKARDARLAAFDKVAETYQGE